MSDWVYDWDRNNDGDYEFYARDFKPISPDEICRRLTCLDEQTAELTRLRDGLDGLIKDYTTMFNAEPHEYLNTIISDLVGLAKHKGGA